LPRPRQSEAVMSEEEGINVVEIRNLTKVFRDFWRRPKVRAVDDLSLDIAAGEVFGVLGPNGSGKSTTIKLLLGLLNPTSGSVSVFGRPPDDVEMKKNIGYLPEESYLYSYLSPRETLDFYGRLFDMGGATRRERIDQLLQMTGLTHAADRAVGEFSKGMARRVGLAQALINDPRLVVLDEPTSGLDPIGCRQVKDLILALAKRGKTVILSSHLLADVEDVCDRVAILYNGKIRAHGRLGELLERRDIMRLSMPVLATDETEKLLGILKVEFGSVPRVDHPSMNLEQFFLEVVEEANKTATHQSGAAKGDGVAEYLRK
jgi:ABC-2 type transport system ATP-binding protein